MTTFAELGVPARMTEALAAAGMTEAFPVQSITLPDALAGRDLCGRAPTGSGKTLGFAIPLLARVGQATPKHPTGLVLVPTRELAEQVQRAMVPLGRAAWRFIQAVYGGAPMGPQIHSLRKGCSVVIATPGRLLDLIEQGHCDLSKVEVLVIDEADRMADLGFMPDVRKILDMTPTTRQTMLWSATLDGDVDELVRGYLNDPVRHDLVDEVLPGNTDHRFVITPAMQRLDATVDLLEKHRSAVVFVKTRFGVDDVTAALMNAGINAGSLHGARTQAARQRTLDDFSRGRVRALVATDVAARGIHVDDVDLVVHYDLPDNEKDYKHRSGRTGRAGRDGAVVAFVPPSRQRVARKLVEALDHEVSWEQGETPSAHTGAPVRPPREVREARRDDDRRDQAGRSSRPWENRNDGGSRPYGDRPSGDRPYGDRPARPAGDRPYNDRGARPYADRGDRPARPAGDRPYNDRGARPYADRGDRPARPAGDRPYNDRGARPYADRGDRPARPAGDRPYNDRGARPYADRGDRPARPAGDRPYADRGARPAWGRDDHRSASSTDRPRFDGAARPAREHDAPAAVRTDFPAADRQDGASTGTRTVARRGAAGTFRRPTR